jgi:hypothetical protein
MKTLFLKNPYYPALSPPCCPSVPPVPAHLPTQRLDYYFCAKNGKVTNNAPDHIRSRRRKAEYSMAAQSLCGKRVHGSCSEEPVGPSFYLANSLSSFITAMDDFPAATDHIMLAGHSFAAVRSLLAGAFPSFCPPFDSVCAF